MVPTVDGKMTPGAGNHDQFAAHQKNAGRQPAGKTDRAIETGGDDGMLTFNQSLFNLVKEGRVSEKEALAKASNPQALEMNFKGIFLNEGGRIVG